jgi:hypothetical protein
VRPAVSQPTAVASSLIGFALLVTAPAQATTQAQGVEPSQRSILVSPQLWNEPPRAHPAAPGSPYQAQAGTSATRIIATHAAVGTAGGLLIGLVLSGASIADDRAEVVLIWTAAGLTAGAVSGVVTWLVERWQ